ncbi:MAG: kelch repeat-containing protein, partial [Planctomycetes bacterium]|nr:kelch repeat-containing protein [Planctomycetota bacterium]
MHLWLPSIAPALLVAGLLPMLEAQDWRQVDGLRQSQTSAAFDLARGRSITVGDQGDTREWDGVQWRHRPIATLPSIPVQMAYDSLRGVTVALVAAGLQLATWEFDGVAWQQRPTAVSPPARIQAGMCFDAARGNVVLFGGSLLGPPYQDTWEWNGVVWQQRAPAVSPPARSKTAMCFDAARGRVVLFGGLPAFPQPSLQDTWEWDGTNWQQRTPANVPPPRAGHALAFDALRQRCVLAGGLGAGAASTWEFDGTTWLQTSGPQPPARANAALVFDSWRSRTVLLGGDLTGRARDVWEWDGTAWAAVAVPSEPEERTAPGLAHSLARDRTVLFGGYGNGSALADTWEWDGRRWLQRQPLVSPPPRFRHAMWNDAADAFVFGGFGAGLVLTNDTWRYDGLTWTPIVSTALPAARRFHVGAFDPAGGGQLLFGGQTAAGTVLGDTWLLRANGWSQAIVSPSPSPRGSPAIATDLARQRVVLFGGIAASGAVLDDTWEWNGVAWTQANPVVRPTQAGVFAMAYEPSLGVVVLVARASQFNQTSNTWLWNGVNWQLHVTQTVLPQPPESWAVGAVGAVRLHDGSHLFEQAIVSPTVAEYGSGCGAPAPRLGADSWPRPGAADFGLTTVGHGANALLLFLLADQPANVPLAGCTLLAQLDGVVVFTLANNQGAAALPTPIPTATGLLGT